jgi:hypothetical protein
MATNYSGETVKGGFYWNARKWDATFVEGERGVLAGEAGDQFRRIPVALALLAAPAMGALFVMFLPFIGIALLLQQMGIASLELAGRLVDRVMMAVSPSWQPGMAYLAGRKRNTSKKAEVAPTAPGTLDELAKEIEERRKQ